jgi:hypothetical protein
MSGKIMTSLKRQATIGCLPFFCPETIIGFKEVLE